MFTPVYIMYTPFNNNSILNYSVQTISPRHHRLATTVFYSGSHQLVHLEHKELERTDVKKRKTMLSETTTLAGLVWPSITTQMPLKSLPSVEALYAPNELTGCLKIEPSAQCRVLLRKLNSENY